MSALEQDLADYLQLRLSLGHELAEARWLLPGFVAYLDTHGSPTVTIEAALAWAQQSPTGRVTTVGPRRMTAAGVLPAIWLASTPARRFRRWV